MAVPKQVADTFPSLRMIGTAVTALLRESIGSTAYDLRGYF